MSSVNKITLVGNLGRDPEVRTLNSGGRVVTLSVATSENYTTKDGSKSERTEWWPVVIWDEKLGEVAEKYLHKGSKVYLTGSGQSRTYTANDGTERSVFEVVLRPFRSELVLLDPSPQSGSTTAIKRNPDPNPAGRPPRPTRPARDDYEQDFAR